ncbi:Uncharacterized protein APZ42_024797 [Daphnia magna]|uniref:Uncharacterized protein n=1 Tax=Daphnia magna TaxID=35525 RepID=A0A164TRF2_9CRUS|nr:Uncharacterized protein APZ42_024797 [Daphnia magna]
MDFKVRNAWPRRRMTAGVCMAILLRYTSDLNHQPPPCFPPFSLIVPMKERRINYGRIKKKKKDVTDFTVQYHLLSTVAAMHPYLHLTGSVTHTYTPERRETHPQREIKKKIFHSTTLHFPILSFTKTLQNKTKNRSFSD